MRSARPGASHVSTGFRYGRSTSSRVADRAFSRSPRRGLVWARMADEREILSWELFGTASRELAQMVADDDFEPDMILSIARGGLLIGGAMGYALSVKNVYTMNVEFYTGVDER